MPTYPVKNTKTGEEKELSMTMKEYSDWRDANPDWDKDWSKGCAGAGEVGDWRNKLDGGWNELLDRVGTKSPRSNIKKYNNY
tara:strand:- start:141 stop:386 length:246 start_codon:yes stop_codon:yes gene_type:complete